MKKLSNGKIIYSPTDLTKFVESPFSSWMDRKSLIDPEMNKLKDLKDVKLQTLFEQGNEFEKKKLSQMKEVFDVLDLGRDANSNKKDAKPLSEDLKIERTINAMKDGREIIYQAFLKKDNFEGYADFLFKVDSPSELGAFSYTVKDTKLAKIPKAKFILQLCSYCEMIEHIQGRLPDTISIILGSNDVAEYKLSDYYFYYQKIKELFIDFHNNFDENKCPTPDKAESSTDWSAEAIKLLEKIDHISLVANISATQVKNLQNSNIKTIEHLAKANFDDVNGIKFEKFEKLSSQAQVQMQSKKAQEIFYKVFTYNPNNPKGLCFLPNKDKIKVYLHIDHSVIAHSDGLAYSWLLKIGEQDYKYFCLNKDEEKNTARLVISQLHDHFSDESNKPTHLYSFSPNALNILKHLSATYNILTEELKSILFNVVDLKILTKQSMVIGIDEYDENHIRPLLKDIKEIGEIVDSTILFHEYETSDNIDTKAALKQSIESNTLLRINFLETMNQWLLKIQEDNDIPYESYNEQEKKFLDEYKKDSKTDEDDEDENADIGLDAFDEEIYKNLSPREKTVKLLDLLCGFYKREDDLVFADLMEKYKQNEEDWDENLDCIAFLNFDNVSKDNERLYHYSYDPSQDTKVREGDSVQLFQNRRLKGVVKYLNTIMGSVHIEYPKKYMQYVQQFHLTYPRISVIVNNYINKKTLIEGVKSVAIQAKIGFADNDKTLGIKSSLYDFLMKNPPNIKNLTLGSELYKEDDLLVDATKHLSERMNNTCLIIQGPPGAGKTFTSANMIINLLEQGKKIAITSNSHKAVNNLMLKIESLSKDKKYGFVKINSKEEEDLKVIQNLHCIPTASKYNADKHPAQVFGGTAYSFSNAIFKDHFDYLFIDEAGQFAMAHLVAVSQCCSNFVLIGDQMQLEQPIQAVHPGDSGKSCLEYYLQEHKTIPREFGFFLPETRRMNPAICEFISEAFYENRLKAHKDNGNRKLNLKDTSLIKINQGIQYVPVHHEGNVQSSVEEIEIIKKVVKELIGQEIIVENEKTSILENRKIELEDFIFVSPYNLQVIKLKEALGEHAKVGSVDLFQGQEAPIVVVSMCSSDGVGGRGIEFLLSENRMNVAISRGKCLAIVVGNPDICKTKVSSIEAIKLLNMYCKLIKYTVE